jgi:hypothetical protein
MALDNTLKKQTTKNILKDRTSLLALEMEEGVI